jgi:maleylpyruvate isomerase
MANCLEGLQDAVDTSPASRAERIVFGATLSRAALRHLTHHSAVHLNVVWRDVLPQLPPGARVDLLTGEPTTLPEVVRTRTQTLWLRALDLHPHATLREAPPEVCARLVDSVRSWAAHGDLQLIPTVEAVRLGSGGDGADRTVRGSLPQLGRWAAGRLPELSRWRAPGFPEDVAPAEVAASGRRENRFAGA